MHLGLRMTPALTQETRLDLRQEQKLALEQALKHQLLLLQRLEEHSFDLFEAGPNPPKVVIANVVRQVLQQVDPKYREGLQLILEDPKMQDLLVEQCAQLAVPHVHRVRAVIVDHLHGVEHGTVSINSFPVEGGQPIHSSVPVDLAIFRQAFGYQPDPECKNPKSIESEMVELTTIARSQEGIARTEGKSADLTGLLFRLNQLGAAKIWRDTNSKVVEGFTNLMIFALSQKDSGGQPLLGGVLRELAMLKKLNFVLSDRLLRRFEERCRHIRRADTPETFERPFCNVVGEYVLTCMGVVDPELFARKQTTISTREEELCQKALADLGIDYDKVREHYKLHGAGTIYWNRWSVVGMKHGRFTDDLVRNFIGQEIWTEKDRILRAAEFPKLFQRIQAARKERRRTDRADTRAEEAASLRQILVDLLVSKPFTEMIVQRIRDRWYPALDRFYQAQRPTQGPPATPAAQAAG